MKKKLFSILLAGTMVASVATAGIASVSAEDEVELAPGGYGTLGEYTPSSPQIHTNRLMFAMPAAWQNDTTKNEKCGGAAGLYWWAGFDTPDNKAGGHGWPGYKAVKVAEEGVDNLWAIDVPTYGNGESGDATQIIWDNYLDGGMERDPAKNPFYNAANQTRDFPGQYYSRLDEHEIYDYLIRYIYKKALSDEGVDGVADLDITSENFWEDLNKASAVYNGEDWEKLDADERTYQMDIILDEIDLDFSEFGTYAGNFFNEDLVEDMYPAESSNGFGAAFTFDNMVFVVNFDPDKMIASPQSGKIGYDGDFYFYYGNGEYGSWPTKDLNEQMKAQLGEDKVVSGNFNEGFYVDPHYVPPTPTIDPETTPGGNKNTTTIPPAGTDAGSSTSDTPEGSDTNNDANGFIATGEFSLAIVVFVILLAGAGVVLFTRKREHE